MSVIFRNGQRSPYSREGLFDFTKGKIFECGDKCSCKDSCKLRMTQRGVAYPLVVCNAGGKGHGVMTTKVSCCLPIFDTQHKFILFVLFTGYSQRFFRLCLCW